MRSSPRRRYLIPVALILIVVAIAAAALRRPAGSGGGSRERNRQATFSSGALEYRLQMERDKFGRVPSNGLVRAKAHVDRMRAARDAALARGVASAAVTRKAWQWLGPDNIGGRVRTLAVHPTNPSIIFAGSAGGGIWKTADGGASWAPVDDFLPVLSVASIVIQPTNANVMYAATGEAYHNGDAILGAGIFKSTDGGTTWGQLPATAADPDFQYFGRLSMSPDGKVLLGASSFHLARSIDGGASFTKTAPPFPVVQVLFHPSRVAEAVAAGYGGALYSKDGGVTWHAASGFSGIPDGTRMELAWAASEPDSVFASVDYQSGWLYKSVDGGMSYSVVYNGFFGLTCCQGWYAQTLWVNPKDANHILVGGSSISESFNGGATWKSLGSTSPAMHVDQHVIVADPRFDNVSNRRLYFGNDGGIYKADDITAVGPFPAPAFTALNHNLGVTQFYGAAGNTTSGVIIGGTQDNGAPRYTPSGGTAWQYGFAADNGYVANDPDDPDIFYTTFPYLSPQRSMDAGWTWIDIGSSAIAGRAARFIPPIILDPNNPQTLLAGGDRLYRTTSARAAAPAWTTIKPPSSNTTDYISAITVAPGDSNTIWVGHTYGDLFKTENGTAAVPTWSRLSIPTLGLVSRVTVSPFNPATVYVTTGSFSYQNIWKTVDGGRTWTSASGSGVTAIPPSPVSDLEINPAKPSTLYAATDVGVFVSTDTGASWQLPSAGPANTRVAELFWMGSRLIAVTHGRGLFAVDVNDTAAPKLGIAPDQLTFPAQTVGSASASRALTLSNTGGGHLTIQSIALSGPSAADFSWFGANCAGRSLGPGASCTTQVVFRPSAAGTRSASVAIASNAASTPDAVALSGSGVTAPPPIPAPWSARDVGSVGLAGGASYANGTFTLKGAGADIWGTLDAFQFVYQPLIGDGSIVARVASVQNVSVWTKAGVMIRQALAPESPHASVFVTPGKGIALQSRAAAGGASANVSVAGAAPRWLKLTRAANLLTASQSADGMSWTTIGQVTIAMPAGVFVGLAVASHDDAQLATAAFDSVAIGSAALPPGWQTSDVGNVGSAGSATGSAGTFTVKGAGADIWDTADAFRFVYRQLAGDGTVTARVATIQNVDAWTKAGVMIRQTLDPGSAHATMLVSAGKGLAFQRRVAAGGVSTNTSLAGTAPRWVRVVRTGQTVAASASADGQSWTTVGQDTVALTGAVWVGMAVSSHDSSQLAAATFDQVSVAAPALPSGWNAADVGGVGVAGSSSGVNGTFTVSGSGADIWATADAFHYAYRTLSGDGQLVARVAAIQNTNRWAKAGVMIRQTLAANSTYALMFVSAGAGTALQYRAGTGAPAVSVAGSTGSAPRWVKVVRAGDMLSGFESVDGTTWTPVGSVAIAMGATVRIGLAVSSHDNAQLCQVTFERVAP